MNINLIFLSFAVFCLHRTVNCQEILQRDSSGPDKNVVYDRITFCYETIFECIQGSERNFGCRKRCHDLEYNPELAHCEADYQHCRAHEPVACHCPGDHKHRKARLWPFNKLNKSAARGGLAAYTNKNINKTETTKNERKQ